MALTVSEIQDRLVQQYNEVELLEILDISAEDLVRAFEDRIIARYDQLSREIDYESI